MNRAFGLSELFEDSLLSDVVDPESSALFGSKQPADRSLVYSNDGCGNEW